MLDEPTNHLDIDSIMWLQDYLASYRGAVLVVTHDRYFLDQVANHIWELSFGKLYHYDGNYQDFVAQKATRVELAQEGERKRQALYKKELAWMRHGAKRAQPSKRAGSIVLTNSRTTWASLKSMRTSRLNWARSDWVKTLLKCSMPILSMAIMKF